jgi:Carboxypeptidase regulatory-like domain/TonB dependent receptor-like, beta-barrel
MNGIISRMRDSFVLGFLVASLFVFSSLASAQGTTGTILGTVTDPSGAVVPGATVTISETQTGVVHKTVTNKQGNYQVPYLTDGTYVVKVDKTGFQATAVNNVGLMAAQTVRIDVKIKLGAVTQTTEVSAASFHLQTDTTVVASTVQSNIVRELPLNGRTFAQLATLVPGVSPIGTSSIGTRRRRGSVGTAIAITSNGFGASQNNYLYDGVGAVDVDSYNFEFAPSIDSIQEFRVQTSTYSAEFGGQPGAQITLITKSGTNQYHGSAWEFNRNDALTARNPFSPKVDRLNRNQFGANLGGPAVKDKLFFFFNWEAGRQIEGNASSLAVVPPTAFRTGDFSSLLPNIIIKDPTTGLPFPGNKITTINPASAALLAVTPEPNISSGSNNFLSSSQSLPTRENQYTGRVDYNLNSRNTFYGRFVYDKLSTPTVAPFFGNDEDNNIATATNYVVNWTHTFSPNLVSSLLVGWNHYFETEAFGTTGNDKYNIACGQMKLPLVACDPLNYGPPVVTAGYDLFSIRANGPRERMNQSGTVTFKNSLQLGKHLIDFGGTLKRVTWTFSQSNQPRGQYTFDGFQTTPTGQTRTAANQFADFLLGLAHAIHLAPDPWSSRENTWWNNVYVQDNWRVLKNVSVNLGLRWDVFTQPWEVHGKLSNFLMDNAGGVLISGGPITPDTAPPGFPHQLVFTNYNDWGPRAGVAWTVRSGTVLRGGYGLYFSPEIENTYIGPTHNPPITLVLNTTLSETAPILYNDATSIQSLFSAKASGLGALGVNPHLPDMKASNWNVTLEQRLPSSMVLNMGYVGSHGDHLTFNRYDGNRPLSPSLPGTPLVRPLAGYGTINVVSAIGSSDYNGLQVQLLRHVGTGLTIMGAYTYSKALGNAEGNSFGGADGTVAILDVLHPELYRSIQSFDIRHRSSISVVYDLPFFKQATGLQHQAFGGWSLNAILTDQTGAGNGAGKYPDASNTGAGSLPDMIANPVLPRSQRSVNKWFNTAAFVKPTPGTFGNAPRQEFHIPGVNTVDFMVGKTFFWGERRSVVFRGEFFNFFNHTNLNSVNTSPTSPAFGTVTSALDPRIIQLGLKLYF